MHTIVAVSQKGGAGKTTLVRNLAIAAWQAGQRVALLDLDPQGSLTAWWNRRESEDPPLVQADLSTLPAAMAKLAEAGIELLLVDTPPSVHPWVGELLRRADLALVPVRPSPDDLDAVGPTLDLVEAAGAPFIFVLSQVKHRTRLAADTLPALAQHGRVAPAVLADRVEYPSAGLAGLGATEAAPDGKAAAETRELLGYVTAQLRKHVRTEAR